jgi:hypothetical protein
VQPQGVHGKHRYRVFQLVAHMTGNGRFSWVNTDWLGGRSGIRTHERVAPLTVFKTVAFVRSAILPQGGYATVWSRHRSPE